MSATYFSPSDLVAAAAACDCTAHIHFTAKGKPVFSIGSSDIGVAEFNSYGDALVWAHDRAAFVLTLKGGK